MTPGELRNGNGHTPHRSGRGLAPKTRSFYISRIILYVAIIYSYACLEKNWKDAGSVFLFLIFNLSWSFRLYRNDSLNLVRKGYNTRFLSLASLIHT